MKQQPVPSLLPCQFLCLLPSLFPFLRNRKNQTNGFVVRFFEEGTNLDGNKYLLFIKDIYRNGYIGERDVCSLVPIFCSYPAWKQHEPPVRPQSRSEHEPPVRPQARSEHEPSVRPQAPWEHEPLVRLQALVESPLGGCGNRRGGQRAPLRGSTQRGLPSGRFFGDFLIGEKVTQGPGLEAPPWGGAQRRASALLASVGEGPPVLHKSPRVWAG